MNPSSGVAGSDPNFVSGSAATRMSSTAGGSSCARAYSASVSSGSGRVRHAGDRAHHPRREPLHDEAVEDRLVDAAGDRDERLDLAVGAALEVEHVREPHDRAHADVVLAERRRNAALSPPMPS
jgi:hypothetical protein